MEKHDLTEQDVLGMMTKNKAEQDMRAAELLDKINKEQKDYDNLLTAVQHIAKADIRVANWILSRAILNYEMASAIPDTWTSLITEEPQKMNKLLDNMGKETNRFFNKMKKMGDQAGVIMELETNLTSLQRKDDSKQ